MAVPYHRTLEFVESKISAELLSHPESVTKMLYTGYVVNDINRIMNAQMNMGVSCATETRLSMKSIPEQMVTPINLKLDVLKGKKVSEGKGTKRSWC